MTAKKLIGPNSCSPRFSTPRNPKRPTLGPAVGEVSRRLKRPLMPWQQLVIDIALELDPDGSYHYDEIVLTVPRQSGKTALVLALVVHRLAVMARQLDSRQRVTYTAQQRQKARLKLERDFAQTLREANPSFREITAIRGKPRRSTEWKISLNNGAENIQFGRGNYLQIDAPSRTGGHGDTLDVGVIDEAFAHQDDTIETGMSPSMITRASRQLVVLSTAGDSQSKYLWRKTLAGRAACESGQHGRTAYFEWSAPDDADPADPATWWSCSPALGWTITLRALEGEWEKALRGGQEGIDKFRRSYLNQWPEVPVLEEEASATSFDFAAWLGMADAAASRGLQVSFGVDVGIDRMANVGVAWRRGDGRTQVMLAAQGLSPLHTPSHLVDLVEEWKGGVTLGGPAASLERDVPGSRVISGSDFAAACGRFEDLLENDDLRHGNQPELNEAVRTALWRPYGASGEKTLQLRDAPAVGPLAAVVRALDGLQNAKKPPARPASASKSKAKTTTGRSETGDLTSLKF